MPAVGKEAFRRPSAPKMERVPVEELGADAYVCVRAISPKDFKELRAARGEQPSTDDANFIYDLLARSLCDDGGERLFSGSEDVADNFGLSMPALDGLVKAAMKVSGISTQDDGKDQVAEKNS